MNKELIEILLNKFNVCNSLEDEECTFVDGVSYYCYLVEELCIEDEGKYQDGGAIFSVGVYDDKKGYVKIENPLFYIEQDFTRFGSYYSDYDYEYHKPYVVEKKEIVTTVWKS